MSAPRIPRAEWPAHPRYATQTLLLDSHEHFRRRSSWIIDHLRDLAPRGAPDSRRRRRWVDRMREDFTWWLSGMHGHERYEERKLYPYLAHRYQLSFAELVEDHSALHECEKRIEQAFTDARAETGQARSLLSMLPLAQLISELERHRATLLDHLQREEERIIPLLLELSPGEFQTYRDSPISVLLEQ